MSTTIKVYAYYAVKSYENKSIKIPTDMGGVGAPGAPAEDPLLVFVSSSDEQ